MENDVNLPSLIKHLYESKTIAPNYKIPHIFFTIMFLGRQKKGIGRYRIKDEVGLGEGSMKTLLNRLKDENIIQAEAQRQKGHSLTNFGRNISNLLNEMVKYPTPIANQDNRVVVGKFACYTILKRTFLKDHFSIGIQQRDEAIKIGGSGATCLTYDGEKIVFPGEEKYAPDTQEINTEGLEKDDLVIIGGGKTPQKATLALFAGTISLLDI